MAFLRILLNGTESRRELGESLVIGRDAQCDLRVDDPKISRLHCMIERTDKGWIAADLDSHNGTLIGGWPLTRQPLKHGDILKLGAASLQFLLQEDARLGTLASELAKLPANSAAPSDSPAATPAPSGLPTPARKKSLWEKATRSSGIESKPSRKRSRKRQTIDLQKLRAKSTKATLAQGPTPVDLTKVAQPWYYRTIRPAIAIPAAVVFLLLVYFLANGFPTLVGSQARPIPQKLPHSSPYNND